MLYAILGNDRNKALAKLDELVSQLAERYGQPPIIRISAEQAVSGVVEEHIGAQDLFHEKIILVLDELLGSEEADVVSHLSDLSDSSNIFIVVESKISAELRKKIEKYSEKIELVELPKGKRETFDIFSLTDALGRRDRKNTWVLYQKARSTGAQEEQLHGMLFWIVKGMLLASASKSAQESGLSPYVFSKASAFAKNYSKAELESLSRDLVTIYHEARRGAHEFPIALERFILSI